MAWNEKLLYPTKVFIWHFVMLWYIVWGIIVLVEECAINGMRVKDSIHNLLSAHLPQYLFKGHVDSYNLKWHMCVQSSNYIHWRICKTLYKHISKFFCLLECSRLASILSYCLILRSWSNFKSLSDNIDFPKRHSKIQNTLFGPIYKSI